MKPAEMSIIPQYSWYDLFACTENMVNTNTQYIILHDPSEMDSTNGIFLSMISLKFSNSYFLTQSLLSSPYVWLISKIMFLSSKEYIYIIYI